MKFSIKKLFLIPLTIGASLSSCKTMNNNNRLAIRREREVIREIRRTYVYDREQFQQAKYLEAKTKHKNEVKEGNKTSRELFLISSTAGVVSGYLPPSFIKKWSFLFSCLTLCSCVITIIDTKKTENKGVPDNRQTMYELQQEAMILHPLP